MSYMDLVVINIYGTSNNTVVSVTDHSQNMLLYRTTGGLHTKAGRDKNSLKTASKIFGDLNLFLTECKTKYIELRVRNKGSCYDKFLTAAVKLLQKSLKTHYNVIRMIDATPITHGYITRQKQKTR